MLNSELLKLPNFIREPNPSIYLESDNYVVIDFETTNLYRGDGGHPKNRIILACWLDGRESGNGGNIRLLVSKAQGSGRISDVHVCRASEYGQRELSARLKTCDFVVAHNAKFELKWLYRMGLDLHKVLPYCTQIGEYVIAGNRKIPLGLEETARRYGVGNKKKLVATLIESGYPVEDMPEKDIEEYCKNDVLITHEIFLKQREILKKEGLLNVFYSRNLVTPALADIEFSGSRLDPERVRDKNLSVSEEYSRLTNRISEITGGINFGSSKQMREYLYTRLKFEVPTDYRGKPILTAGGKPKTDIKTINLLHATTPEQSVFLDAIRAAAPLKKRKQILEAMVKCVEEDRGEIYATFNQTVTQTHRLSSTGGKYGFQYHNFPRDFKVLFRPRNDEWVCCEADESQLEFRVAVDLGNDPRGREDIRRGVDIHKLTASTMGIDRQTAKTFTFKPLYGGRSGDARMRRYFKAFQKRYESLYRIQTGWTYEVLGNKKLVTPTGLKFYWPDTEISRTGYITNTTNIFNYPIQMFATADIVPLALVLTWHLSKDLRAIIFNTVHDSVIAEVHPEDLAKYKEFVKWSFTEGVIDLLFKLYCYIFKTPLAVEIKTGTHWGEGEVENHEFDPEVNRNV